MWVIAGISLGSGRVAVPAIMAGALNVAGLALAVAHFKACARRYADTRGAADIIGLGGSAAAFLVNFVFCLIGLAALVLYLAMLHMRNLPLGPKIQ
jgi:hypothetical protein